MSIVSWFLASHVSCPSAADKIKDFYNQYSIVPSSQKILSLERRTPAWIKQAENMIPKILLSNCIDTAGASSMSHNLHWESYHGGQLHIDRLGLAEKITCQIDPMCGLFMNLSPGFCLLTPPSIRHTAHLVSHEKSNAPIFQQFFCFVDDIQITFFVSYCRNNSCFCKSQLPSVPFHQRCCRKRPDFRSQVN